MSRKITIKPRVTWRRQGQCGRVSIIGLDGGDAAVNRMLDAGIRNVLVQRAWLHHDNKLAEISIRQPPNGGLGGAAEREHVDRLLKLVRDVVKAVVKSELKVVSGSQRARTHVQYRVVYVTGETTIVGVEASSINVGFAKAVRVASDPSLAAEAAKRGMEISRIEFWQKVGVR